MPVHEMKLCVVNGVALENDVECRPFPPKVWSEIALPLCRQVSEIAFTENEFLSQDLCL